MINLPTPTGHWDILPQSHHARIEPSYWHSIGRGDVYADAMIGLQDELVEWTVKLYHKHSQNRDEKVQLLPFWMTRDSICPFSSIIIRHGSKKCGVPLRLSPSKCQKTCWTNWLEQWKWTQHLFSDQISISFDNNRLVRVHWVYHRSLARALSEQFQCDQQCHRLGMSL